MDDTYLISYNYIFINMHYMSNLLVKTNYELKLFKQIKLELKKADWNDPFIKAKDEILDDEDRV